MVFSLVFYSYLGIFFDFSFSFLGEKWFSLGYDLFFWFKGLGGEVI